jgi:hypothetical protein
MKTLNPTTQALVFLLPTLEVHSSIVEWVYLPKVSVWPPGDRSKEETFLRV